METSLTNAINNAAKLNNLRDMEILQSFLTQYKQRGTLTARQESFAKVLIERNSDEIIRKSAEYLGDFKDETLKAEAIAVCKYYTASQYYRQGSICKRLLEWFENPDTAIPPTYPEWQRIFENKYAKLVRDSHNNAPLWKPGDLVMIRKASAENVDYKGAGRVLDVIRIAERHYYSPRLSAEDKDKEAAKPYIWDIPMTIIQVDSKPISKAMTYKAKAGGTRWYTVLPLGFPFTIKVMERDLKKVIKKRIS